MIFGDENIDVLISKNNVPTLRMLRTDCINYCIQYIDTLRLRENELIYSIISGNHYVNTFGKETLTVHLLNGIKQGLINYYKPLTDKKEEIITLYNRVVSRENDALDDINNKYGIDLVFASLF